MFCLMAVSLKYKWIFQPFCKLFAKQARLCKLVAGCMLSNCWSLSAWYRLHANIQVHSNLAVNKSAPLFLSWAWTTVSVHDHRPGTGLCPWPPYRWWFLTLSVVQVLVFVRIHLKVMISNSVHFQEEGFLSVSTVQMMVPISVHSPFDDFCPCPLYRLLFLSVCAS